MPITFVIVSANKGKYLIIVAGPTAVGKTSASIAIALAFGAEIFSCDSRQVYQEMSIGTAKPSENELAQICHHFIGTKSIHDKYTAGDYERDVDLALHQYFKEKDVAVITGGTGLYIDAVLKGLDEFPEVSDEIYEELEDRLENGGIDSLTEQLFSLDPVTHSNIDLQNSRRIIRALAVCLAEGKPYSSYLRKKEKELGFTPVLINLERSREELYDRINRRVDQMLENGLLNEVKSLTGYRDLRSLQTVGYSELFDFLDGKTTYEEAVELLKRNSRRYAKRQMTWFRNKGNYNTLPADDIEGLVAFIKKTIS